MKNAVAHSKEVNSKEFVGQYLGRLEEILASLNHDEISRFMDALLAARDRGSRIFFIGNGGSAATASHFANDVGIGTRSWQKPFQAIALTDNVAVMTAIGNDYGYDQIFTLQLKTLLKPDDVVVAISASGNSPNVLRAIEYANEKGALTIGLTGFDGGELRKRAQLSVHVPSQKGEYGPVEDVHMIFDHLSACWLRLVTEDRPEYKSSRPLDASPPL